MKCSLKYPDKETLDWFLEGRKQEVFSYKELGQSQEKRIIGYDNDHNKILLGQGEVIWENAKTALNNWQQFPEPWTKIYPNTTPLLKGNTVVVLFKLFGLWWHNSARIVYNYDEADRYGFAYGTLLEHVEQGEEFFWIERDKKGDIYYHIQAFSKPRFWLAKLAYPIARMYQRKFVKESLASMKQLANMEYADK